MDTQGESHRELANEAGMEGGERDCMCNDTETGLPPSTRSVCKS
jgi:hypothetical protein